MSACAGEFFVSTGVCTCAAGGQVEVQVCACASVCVQLDVRVLADVCSCM